MPGAGPGALGWPRNYRPHLRTGQRQRRVRLASLSRLARVPAVLSIFRRRTGAERDFYPFSG